MSAGRALEAALDAMHGVVAEALTTELRHHMQQLDLNPQRVADYTLAVAKYEGELSVWEETNGDPEEKPKEPKALLLYQIPPQFLDKVLKFLAQNGINAPKQAPRVDALAATLADLDLDAEATRRPI